MRRNSLRLSGRHRAWLYSIFGILFLSGLSWLGVHFGFRKDGDVGLAPLPAEPWLLKAHGAAAMAALVLLGTLLPGHVRRGWNARRNRLAGVGFIILNFPLILTGYALYYFGGEQARPIISVLHWALGIAFPAALFWHIRQGRRSKTPVRSLES